MKGKRKEMKSLLWYALAIALMTYPIAELSRVIVQYSHIYSEIGIKLYIQELIPMWIAYFLGIIIMAWRIVK